MDRKCLNVYNLVGKLTVFLILLYQYIISPGLGKHCRFYPSCSEYTKIAIEKYGVIKGIFLGLKRVLRCNPLNSGGLDFP